MLLKNCSEIVRGVDAIKVTCEVNDADLKRTIICDFGDYQIRIDDDALSLVGQAVDTAADALMARYKASPPDSELRQVVDARMAEQIAQAAVGYMVNAVLDGIAAKKEAVPEKTGSDENSN